MAHSTGSSDPTEGNSALSFFSGSGSQMTMSGDSWQSADVISGTSAPLSRDGSESLESSDSAQESSSGQTEASEEASMAGSSTGESMVESSGQSVAESLGESEETPLDEVDSSLDPAAGYVGMEKCGQCHRDLLNSFERASHAYALEKIIGTAAPYFPASELYYSPDQYEWSDISYVVGGARWMAHFLNLDGYFITKYPDGSSHQANQNLTEASAAAKKPVWTSFASGQTLRYRCGRCHSTNYQAKAAPADGLPGIIGAWAFPGIQCEECHGPGKEHVTKPARSAMLLPTDSDACQKCHAPDESGLIPAQGGYVSYPAQWPELVAANNHMKAGVTCSTCHDVHQPVWNVDRLNSAAAVRQGNPMALDGLPPLLGIKQDCNDCHSDITVDRTEHQDCKSCHMAFTARVAENRGSFFGDSRSHVFHINTDPTATMWRDANGQPTTDPAAVRSAAPFITLDFACLRCHGDKDQNWAAIHSGKIHPVAQ
jgi:hypothetical protein